MDRVISIIKPAGMTSHDVVYRVRKILGIKKVGHTGTLDPDATGVLPICVGRATKLSDLILNKDKTYVCELTLGLETDTYDTSGNVLFTKSTEGIGPEDVRSALQSQVGVIDQMPPVYSALKVNGKRMCDLARSGRAGEIEVKPRKIEIKSIEILRMDIPKVLFRVKCSKGTYVRSICHDTGDILGTGGCMSFLERTKSGIFTLERSITLDELELYHREGTLDEHSFSIEDVLVELPEVMLADNAVKYYSNGGKIESGRFTSSEEPFPGQRVRVYSKEGFIGTGKISDENDDMFVKSEKFFNI